MHIRAKLAWTYSILLIVGVIAISAYAILSIRSFLLSDAETTFTNNAYSIQLAISNFPADGEFWEKVQAEAEFSGFELAVYNDDGYIMSIFPDTLMDESTVMLDEEIRMEINESPDKIIVKSTEESPKLIAYISLHGIENPAKYVRISQYKKKIYAAIDNIRYIIYYGMGFSVIAILVFSFIFSSHMARPILQLNDAALDIAGGNLDGEILLNRKDEYGTLADSLNQMKERLREDTRKIEAINERQTQFFADITHEVRNPLHSISGALEMLEMDNITQEQKKDYIMVAQKQLIRIVRLFEDLKTLQRYDFDDSFIDKKEFDVSKIIAETVEVNKPFAKQKNLTLNYSNNSTKAIFADPLKIEQVMENLITNAIKYTNEGTVSITSQDTETGVMVTVSDTGIGISNEHLNRLFDRFYRTDKSRSRDQGGTGLGLAVVKSILSAHNTEVKVESAPGKGSTFTFTLSVA